LSRLIHELERMPLFGLGCSSFGGVHWGSQSDRDSLAALEAAVESGVRHLDTAAAYGAGRSETVTGRLLKRRPGLRQNLMIASKSGLKGSGANFLKEIDKSRRRLNCDTLDICYIHWPVSGIDPRPSLEALARARETGSIRYIGLSNFTPRAIIEANSFVPIDACQFGYNLIWRNPEKELIPLCSKLGIARIAYGTLAQGLLCGRIGPQTSFPPGDDRGLTRFFAPGKREEVFKGIAELNEAAGQRGMSLIQAVRLWCATVGTVDQFLIGARNRRQALENFGPLERDMQLTEELERTGERISRLFAGEDNFFGFKP
jgi:aryl-alcohol dehydrogenase-like predicted oxidoreductase